MCLREGTVGGEVDGGLVGLRREDEELQRPRLRRRVDLEGRRRRRRRRRRRLGPSAVGGGGGGREGAAAVADGADGGGVAVVEGELAARRVHLEDVAVEDGRALDLELEPRVEREPGVLRAFGVEHHLVRARGARAVLRAQLQELAALDVHQLDRLAVVDRRA